MAGKRTAESDLNHENWEEENEPEEAGSFKKASQDVLQKRVIKTAKRRNLIPSNDSNAKSLFGNFSGFNKNPTTSFAFLNNVNAEEDVPTVNGMMNTANKSNTSIQTNNINSSIIKAPECKINEKDEYFAKLKGLNESVSIWIKKHVDANPFVNLKPIFGDYEKYFNELESKSNISTNDSAQFKKDLSSFVFKAADVGKSICENKSTSQFSFGSVTKIDEKKNILCNNTKEGTLPLATSEKNESKGLIPSPFSFGSKLNAASVPTISFTSTTESKENSFSFSTSNEKPFTFTNVTQSTNHQEKNEDQDDEPPKVEFTPVTEDGHTYTVRCKVFVKNETNFGDRGVGVLYLKPVPNMDKTQLIVRADTNLGNLLCNFILSKNIPTKRMGKKDVMLVCLPTPECKPPPVPILLRVKSSEQADELLGELEKHKK